MPVCPDGHQSATTDYCDVCGLVLGAAPPAPASAAPESSAPVSSALPCNNCGEPREGRFCEDCGFDNDLPAPPKHVAPAPILDSAPVLAAATPSQWTAIVRADRAWFEEVRRQDGPESGNLEFPRYCPERRFTLDSEQMTIGRTSRSRGTNPEIDLGTPPIDPGISSQHALLIARSDNGWEVVDLGSTNGTSVGDSTALIAPHTPVQVAAGEQIRLGAWTVITLEQN